MTSEPPFVVDSDVLITAKNRYYTFGICPGFWDSLIHHNKAGGVYSIDRVQQELLTGRDDDELVHWVKDDLPEEFFLSTHDTEVVAAYTEIMLWAQRNPQYLDDAKAKFATGADGWLVAYVSVRGGVVVTNEQPRPEARNQIKLPDVCNQFGVAYQDTFDMLRTLRVRYEFSGDK